MQGYEPFLVGTKHASDDGPVFCARDDFVLKCDTGKLAHCKQLGNNEKYTNYFICWWQRHMSDNFVLCFCIESIWPWGRQVS